MAKRFTDTDKWKKPFVRSLPVEYKLLWFYILDDCDFAGIWEVDFEIANIKTGMNLDEKKAKELFKNHIQIFDGGQKWFIADFISFQYGELVETNRMHKGVINLLNKYSSKGLRCPFQGAKEQEQDKEQDKVKVKEQDFGKSENLLREVVQVFDAEQEILSNEIWLNNISMAIHKSPQTARDALRGYHLWLIREDKYPQKRKQIYAGFEKWLRDEKKFNNGTYKQNNGERPTATNVSSRGLGDL